MTLIRALWGLMALVLIASVITLSMWGIPAPSVRVEKIIPHEKLPQ